MSGGRWLKLYTGLRLHPKWRLKLPDDTARVAYVMALMAAKEAGNDGRFESREHLGLVLGEPYAGAIEAMIEAGLIDELPETGELWMHDFETRQSPLDPKGAARARKYRAKKGGGGGSNGSYPPVDSDVDKPSRRDVTHASRRDSESPSRRGVTRDAEPRNEKVTRYRIESERERESRSIRSSTARETYIELFGVTPTRRIDAIITSLIRDHGDANIANTLRSEHSSGGREDLLSRVGRRCRQQARERTEADDRARSASEQRAAIADEQRMAEAPLEVKERAAGVRQSIATWAGAFGAPRGEA